ncbi:MAG: hypothetical protein GY847_14840 [Proteobacteria bacterium]|nr:hypothetical protein [Pseudomonadota bacterium]
MGNNKIKYIIWIALTVLILVTSTAFTQEINETTQDAQESPTSEPEKLAIKLEAMEQELKKLKTAQEEQRIDQAETAQLKEEMEQLKSKIAEMEKAQTMSDFEEDAQDYAIDHLSFFGYFDLKFAKSFMDDRNLFKAVYEGISTFYISDIHLYIKSEMTQSLSALVELGFIFSPHGADKSYEHSAFGTEYERIDSSFVDPRTTKEHVYGGLIIERAHLTYSPVDWFGVIAGRYLTPYGIWNIEHSPTVVTTIRTPYMQLRQMVPLAQTGLQVFGRLYPSDTWIFDYGITLSNGRGPIESVKDLDENKGLGMRLKLTYMGDNIMAAAGSYGYFGSYTDIKKVAISELNPDLTLNKDVKYPLFIDIVTTSSYDEYLVSSDIVLEIFGVKLQAEYVYRYVHTLTPSVRSLQETALAGAPPTEILYTASSVGLGAYGLIMWDLPIAEKIGGVRLAPYFMYEYNDTDSNQQILSAQLLVAGLNIKPSPYVTLKAEYMRILPTSDLAGNVHVITAQMAISF